MWRTSDRECGHALPSGLLHAINMPPQRTMSESLSPAERTGESIYRLMQRGMSREDYVRRMHALEETSPVAACYVSWLLLRDVKPSLDRDRYWGMVVGELRAARQGVGRAHRAPRLLPA